jgi:hypothetical protein
MFAQGIVKVLRNSLVLVSTLTSTFTSIGAFAANGTENQSNLVFSVDSEGNPQIFAENLPGSVEGRQGMAASQRLWGMSEKEKFDSFVKTLMDTLKGAYNVICDLPLMPTGFSLTAEVVSAKWEQKQLCSKRSEELFNANSFSSEPMGVPVFRLPKLNKNSLRGIPDSIQALQIQKDFLKGVSKFFCDFPVRPSEIDVKTIPVKVEWNIDSACKRP